MQEHASQESRPSKPAHSIRHEIPIGPKRYDSTGNVENSETKPLIRSDPNCDLTANNWLYYTFTE